MSRDHRFRTVVNWTGNTGTGTSAYGAYSRRHEISAHGKAAIAGSSDPTFRGDADRYNPEELLVASLSSCHMLWYLHLCSEARIAVTSYSDDAEGTLSLDAAGDGRFERVVLRPVVTVALEQHVAAAIALHEEAHRRCFIAKSVRFEVAHEPLVTSAPAESLVN